MKTYLISVIITGNKKRNVYIDAYNYEVACNDVIQYFNRAYPTYKCEIYSLTPVEDFDSIPIILSKKNNPNF